MKRSTRQDKPKSSQSFAFVSGEMYYRYVQHLGEDSKQAQYYLDLFPDKKKDPEAYAKYKAEFEAGQQAQKDLEKEEK